MTHNRRQILDLLAQSKINVDEAERLLSLVDQPPGGEVRNSDASDASKPPPKYLRVVVEPGSQNAEDEGAERVNIRVPLAIIRAGVKLSALLPTGVTDKVNEKLQAKGIGLDLGANLEQLVDAIADLEVDVHGADKKVRIFVE